jgi:hypothetical protein
MPAVAHFAVDAKALWFELCDELSRLDSEGRRMPSK